VTRAKKEREKEKKEMGGLRSKIPVLKATVVWLAVLSILPAMLLASCVFEAVGPDGKSLPIDHFSLKTLEIVVREDGSVDLSRVPIAGTLIPAVMRLYGFDPETILPETLVNFVRESKILSFRITKVKDGLTFFIDGQRMLTFYGGTKEWENFAHWYPALMPADIFGPTIAEVAKLIPLPGFDIVVLFEQEGGLLSPVVERITSAELEKIKPEPVDLTLAVRITYDENGAPSISGVNIPELLDNFSIPAPGQNELGDFVLDQQTSLKEILDSAGVIIPGYALYLNPASQQILLKEGVKTANLKLSIEGLKLRINEDDLPAVTWNTNVLNQMEAKAFQLGWNPMGLVNALGRIEVGVTVEFAGTK